MSKHEHIECAHKLEWCARCSVPYCTKCEKEWADPCRQSHYYWTNSGHTSGTITQSAPSITVNSTALRAEDYPALAGVGRNHSDCIYDEVSA